MSFKKRKVRDKYELVTEDKKRKNIIIFFLNWVLSVDINRALLNANLSAIESSFETDFYANVLKICNINIFILKLLDL